MSWYWSKSNSSLPSAKSTSMFQRADVLHQAFNRSLQITGSSIACLRKRLLQAATDDHHPAPVELAHARGNHMHADGFRLLTTRPGKLDIVFGLQLSGVVAQSLPPPPLGLGRISDT